MRIRQRDSTEEAPVNLMPLIDMVFLLLIFFLVASTFAQEERDLEVQVPVAAVQALSEAPQELIINIRADGSLRVGGEAYTRQRLGQLLAQIAREQPGRKVLIRGHKASRYEYFAQVAALCQRSGIASLNIAVLPPGEG